MCRMNSVMTVGSCQVISSAANPLVKQIRRALTRGGLTEQGLMVAESVHLLREAFQSKLEIPTVLVAASVSSDIRPFLNKLQSAKTAIVEDALFEKIVSTKSSQGVVTLVRPPLWSEDELFCGRPLVIIFDGVQDPGNAGTITRSVEAFGGTGIVFMTGAVNPFNSKLLRASAGSIFRVPFVYGIDRSSLQVMLEGRELQMLASDPRAKTQIADYDLSQPTALLIGSEGRGVSSELKSRASGVRILTTGVESLNVATAASILLHEAARARREKNFGP